MAAPAAPAANDPVSTFLREADTSVLEEGSAFAISTAHGRGPMVVDHFMILNMPVVTGRYYYGLADENGMQKGLDFQYTGNGSIPRIVDSITHRPLEDQPRFGYAAQVKLIDLWLADMRSRSTRWGLQFIKLLEGKRFMCLQLLEYLRGLALKAQADEMSDHLIPDLANIVAEFGMGRTKDSIDREARKARAPQEETQGVSNKRQKRDDSPPPPSSSKGCARLAL